MFKTIRFAENDGEPYCPHCGIDAVYEYRARRLFKCQDCEKQFSVTSGTVFRSRKMSYADIMLAVVLFVNGREWERGAADEPRSRLLLQDGFRDL